MGGGKEEVGETEALEFKESVGVPQVTLRTVGVGKGSVTGSDGHLAGLAVLVASPEGDQSTCGVPLKTTSVSTTGSPVPHPISGDLSLRKFGVRLSANGRRPGPWELPSLIEEVETETLGRAPTCLTRLLPFSVPRSFLYFLIVGGGTPHMPSKSLQRTGVT